MKRIKKILLSALMLTGILATSCTDYQDEINALDYRVTKLEELVTSINTNLKALETIVQALDSADYITAVTPTNDGYVMNFKKYGPVYIVDGVDGLDGKDAQAPDIRVAKDPITGEWYWIRNGDWLTVDGERIRVNGKDGKDGKDAISPKVRINSNTGNWDISYDDGQTWISTGTYARGNDGKDGKDGNIFLVSISKKSTPDGTFIVIETKWGDIYYVPFTDSQNQ